jgi:hypothetical protein
MIELQGCEWKRLKKLEAVSEGSDLLCKMASTVGRVQDFVKENTGKVGERGGEKGVKH